MQGHNIMELHNWRQGECKKKWLIVEVSSQKKNGKWYGEISYSNLMASIFYRKNHNSCSCTLKYSKNKLNLCSVILFDKVQFSILRVFLFKCLLISLHLATKFTH